tara:strand:- start:5579 stop:6337 length:759 start_codon:yes stop_codon:yes gene_type:complete
VRNAHCRTSAGRHQTVRFVALFFLSGLLSGAAMPSVTVAQRASTDRPVTDPYAAHIAEASQKFGIPERWIRAVMQVESAGRVRAVSHAGAMGLMQIMPDTWAGLRVRHRLGSDPFDPHDNILGGTAYLREMYDRFGSPGFLAAYNAGPGRYEDHLATGRALPRETRAYMATLLPMIGLASSNDTTTIVPAPPDWREAPLFVERLNSSSTAYPMQEERRTSDIPPTPPARNDDAQSEQPKSVFIAQSRDERTP